MISFELIGCTKIRRDMNFFSRFIITQNSSLIEILRSVTELSDVTNIFSLSVEMKNTFPYSNQYS